MHRSSSTYRSTFQGVPNVLVQIWYHRSHHCCCWYETNITLYVQDLETTLQMLGIDGEPGSRVTRSPHAPLVNADDLKTRLSSMDSITQAAIPRSRRTRIRSPKRRSPKRRSSITTKPSSNPSLTKPSSSTAIMPPNIKPSSSPAIMPTLIKPPPPTPSQTVSNALALAHTAIVRAGLDSRDCLVRFDQIWKSFLRANLDQPSCGIVPLPSPPCPSPASTSGLTTPTCLTCTRCQRQMNDDRYNFHCRPSFSSTVTALAVKFVDLPASWFKASFCRIGTCNALA